MGRSQKYSVRRPAGDQMSICPGSSFRTPAYAVEGAGM